MSSLLGSVDQDLADDLAKWCRDPEKKQAFVFAGDELVYHVAAKKETDTLVEGRFELTLEWLLDAYKKTVDDFSIPASLYTYLRSKIYSSYIKLTYEMAGDQRVLSCIKDENDDPFTSEDGVMRGFQRCCPKGHPLSLAVGKAREYVIALSGSPRAGKTSCITSIMRALRDGLYQQEFLMSMIPYNNDPQWKKLEGEVDLFREGWAIDKTGISDTELTYSILVRLGNQKRVLTFVDMPGEFWEKEGSGFSKEWYTQYSGIYENLDCIWLFISKWTAYGDAAIKLGTSHLSELEAATAETAEQVKNGDPANLNANLSWLSGQLAAAGKRMPPVAVVLTKGDVQITNDDWQDAEEYGLFPVRHGSLAAPDEVSNFNNDELRSLLPRSESSGLPVLNEYEYWKRSHKVRAFLRHVNAGALSEAIEQNCPRRTYISMAAYGHAAPMHNNSLFFNDTVTPFSPTPYHEMLPLLWTFAVLGALPVKHPCEWYKENLLRQPKLERRRELEIPFSYRLLDSMLAKRRKAEGDKTAIKQLKKDGFDFEKLQNLEDIGKNLLLSTNLSGKTSYVVTKINV